MTLKKLNLLSQKRVYSLENEEICAHVCILLNWHTCVAAVAGVPSVDVGLMSEAPGPRGVEPASTEFSAPPLTRPRREDRLLSLQGVGGKGGVGGERTCI